MTLSNLTEYFRIFPLIDSHQKQKLEAYFNIRVVSRANKNNIKDIPVYFDTGVRVKVKPKSFELGKVKKGYYTDSEPWL